ncbi:MAG: methyl-accepting chemotaxis protein [Desulfatiglandaceae bacterium]
MRPIFGKDESCPFFLKKRDIQTLKNRVMENFLDRFRTNGRVGILQKQISELGSELDAACKDADPLFMGAGEELQTIYRSSRELTQQVRESVQLIGGDTERGVLFKMQTLAHAALNELTLCRNNVSEKSQLTEKAMAQLRDLSRMCESIEKTGLLLKIIGVNIGIESSRSNEANDLFLVVGQETSGLSKKIAAIAGESLDVLKSAQGSQQFLYRELSEGLKEIDRLGQNARRIVRVTVQEIESLMGATLQVTDQARKRADAISGQVGKLVVSIQFHDDMTQRVAHVQEALENVKERLADAHGNGDKGNQNSGLSRVISIIGVQSAQLKEIIAEIEGVHEKSVQSLEEIHGEVDRLLEDLFSLSDGESLNSEGKGRRQAPFKRLSTSFNDLNHVLQRGQLLMQPMQDAASRASEAAAHISKFVQDIHSIGFESHLMALNAIVKAARLGSTGGALEVLAQEVKQSADQTASLLDRTDEVLGRVTDVSDRLKQNLTNGDSGVSLKAPMAEITTAYDRFTETAASGHEQADAVRGSISKTKSDLDFLSQLRERFSGALEKLEQMAHDLSACVAHDQKLSAEETDELLQRYTMEKERRVHQASLSGPFAQGMKNYTPESSPGSGNQLSSESAGATDNVELFGDEPETETTSNANMELFDEGPGPETQPGEEPIPENRENQKEKQDFGDNVELF